MHFMCRHVFVRFSPFSRGLFTAMSLNYGLHSKKLSCRPASIVALGKKQKSCAATLAVVTSRVWHRGLPRAGCQALSEVLAPVQPSCASRLEVQEPFQMTKWSSFLQVITILTNVWKQGKDAVHPDATDDWRIGFRSTSNVLCSRIGCRTSAFRG